MFTVILFLLHQFTADTISLFSSSAISAAEVPVMVMVASFAKKSIRDLLISRARSLIYIRKRRGPKTDPCSTPEDMCIGLDNFPAIETSCCHL